MHSCESEAELPLAGRGSRSGDLCPSRGGHAGITLWDHILGSHLGIAFWDHIWTQTAQDEGDGQVGSADTQLPLGKKKTQENPSAVGTVK